MLSSSPPPPALQWQHSSVNEGWDQRLTLLPPPYTGLMRKQLPGLFVGDPLVDALPASAVTCHGGERRKLDLGPDPEWVDWESVARGQQVWMNRLGQFNIGLTLALLQGFSIARFAVVLYHNGYAQSGETSYDRYRETAFAIIDWMRYSLKDPSSQARSQLQNVRAMHSFARRRSQRLFGEGEGVALSQYDMAEVQMAFASVAPIIAEREMRAVPLTQQEKKDVCHAWRVVGYFLGIHDEFNMCADVDTMSAMTEEWLEWVPLRMKTCREQTFILQKAALDGFGLYTGVGSELFVGILHASCSNSAFEVEYLQQPSLTGMKGIGRLGLTMVGFRPVNWVFSKVFVLLRDEWDVNPKRQTRMKPVLMFFSRFHDKFVWRLAGIVFHGLTYNDVVGVVVSYLVVRRLAQRVRVLLGK
jgi:hypothetical protein